MKGIGLYQLKEKVEKVQKELSTLKALITKMQGEIGEVDPKTGSQELVKTFCETFKARWQVNPTLGGPQIGALTNLLKSHGLEKSKRLVVAYISMSDSFFIKKRHDPLILLQNITTVGHFADTGKVINGSDAKTMERGQKYADLFNQVDSGKL
jgi:hypothetical protein